MQSYLERLPVAKLLRGVDPRVREDDGPFRHARAGGRPWPRGVDPCVREDDVVGRG